MISKLDARNIALRYLIDIETEIGEPLELMDSKTLEKSFGWVFFYNSKSYLETGNFLAMLAGNSPFIIDRNDGAVHQTGTSKPIDEYINTFENNWNSR